MPKVLSTARGCRPRAVLKTKGTVFSNTDQPRTANNVFIFFFGTALKATFVLNSAQIWRTCAHSRKIKNVFVIGIHNCLTLSKKSTFYVVYNTFTLLQKALNVFSVGNFGAVHNSGSGWENTDPWSARN